MTKEFFKNLPDTTTPFSAQRMNGLLNGDEALGNIVVSSITSKNLLCIHGVSNAAYASFDSSTNKITLSTDHTQTTFLRGTKGLVLKAGQPYTVTIFLDKVSTTTDSRLYMRFDSLDTEAAYAFYFGVKSEPLIKSHTFTLDEDLEVARVGFYLTNAGITFRIQLEKGSVSTDYAPYQNFAFTNPILELGRETYEKSISTANEPVELTFNYETFDNIGKHYYIIMIATRITDTGGFKRYLRKSNGDLQLLDDVNPNSNNSPELYTEGKKIYLKMHGATSQSYKVGVVIEKI